MNLHTALRAALRALTANLLRSVLTMLGVIIGVGAVIAMLAVGRGATERVQEQIKGLGSNIVLVVPGSLSAARHSCSICMFKMWRKFAMSLRVAIYCRVSSDRQREQGTIGSQREALLVHAQSQGWNVVRMEEDDGVSGEVPPWDRPAMSRVLGLVRRVRSICCS